MSQTQLEQDDDERCTTQQKQQPLGRRRTRSDPRRMRRSSPLSSLRSSSLLLTTILLLAVAPCHYGFQIPTTTNSRRIPITTPSHDHEEDRSSSSLLVLATSARNDANASPRPWVIPPSPFGGWRGEDNDDNPTSHHCDRDGGAQLNGLHSRRRRPASSPSSLGRASLRGISSRTSASHGRSTLRTSSSSTVLYAAAADEDTTETPAPTKKSKSDLLEFKAAVAAFSMYQTAYGNLQVPQRFIVPNMKPWPRASWGLRLGRLAAAVRTRKKFTRPSQQALLRDMGFEFVESNESTQTPVAKKKRAKKKKKKSTAAKTVAAKRPASATMVDLADEVHGTAGATPPDALNNAEAEGEVAPPPASPTVGLESILDKLTEGQEESANDIRFRKVYTALATYKEIFGDLLVPQPFVVPSESPQWPEDTWNLRLGARVNAIRSQGTFVSKNPDRKKLLTDLGFVWTPQGPSRRGRREMAMIAADEEDARNVGRGVVATEGVKKSSSPSPDDALAAVFDPNFDFKAFGLEDGDPLESEKDAAAASKPKWSFEGGGTLSDLTNLDRATAAALGSAPVDELKEERTLAEVMEYAANQALEVGIIEGRTENNRVVKGKQHKNIPWFNDDFGGDFVFEDVVEALTLYKSFYGGDFSNLTLNYDFVVPFREEVTGFLNYDDLVDGPDDLLGKFDTDASARAARAIASFEEEGDFESSEDLIAAEIRRLQQEVGVAGAPPVAGGDDPVDSLEADLDTSMASAMAIADMEEWESSATADAVATAASLRKPVEWPEYLGGMQLGSLVSRIQDGSLEVKHLPERKAQLDALDFDWGDDRYFLDVPFEKAMCAMYAYYLIRGDLFVYEDFCMPDEDPWPSALAGYELGKAVKRYRELQNFLEAYHPEKLSLLRMLDFVWFPTMALPLDPNEPEMDDEWLRLTAMGHPDYSKMVDIPMGLPDKLIADGPFFETDNPKLWWRKYHDWEYVKDYWYQMGRRDNAWVLRRMGFPQMAAEHEERYGPGLFTQINATLFEIERLSQSSVGSAGDAVVSGADSENSDTTRPLVLEGLSLDERKNVVTTLSYYRQELLGCTDLHPLDCEELIVELDTKMVQIVKANGLESWLEEAEEEEAYEEEYEEVGDDGGNYEGGYEEDYEEEVDFGDEEGVDVEDELGLESQR